MDGQPGDKSPGYYRVSLRDEEICRAMQTPRLHSAIFGGIVVQSAMGVVTAEIFQRSAIGSESGSAVGSEFRRREC
jgi:hypothetical protein